MRFEQGQAAVGTFWLSSALLLFCCISFRSHWARSSGKKSFSAASRVLGEAPLSYLQSTPGLGGCHTALQALAPQLCLFS